jgi:DNA-binding Xre family transcriptional regulator
MAISYKKLWKLLIDRDLKKKDLRQMAGISASSITKLGKDENVNTEILERICKALDATSPTLWRCAHVARKFVNRMEETMDTNYTPHQKRYFAEQLTLSRPAREIEALASSMSGVKVDLNPHQVEAALFALRSPISNGALLADEVGLGKTIEAGLVLAQFWAERKQRILLILPASLRIQWKTELEEKFNIPCVIIERPKRRKGVTPPANLFLQATHDKKVAICSYEFASASKDSISAIPWDLVIIDEAHRLRNIYKKTGNARAKKHQTGLGRQKEAAPDSYAVAKQPERDVRTDHHHRRAYFWGRRRVCGNAYTRTAFTASELLRPHSAPRCVRFRLHQVHPADKSSPAPTPRATRSKISTTVCRNTYSVTISALYRITEDSL